MAHIGCLAVLTLVVGGLSGCLLDTEPVNHRPTVKVTGPASFKRGKPEPFNAEVTDPDQPPGSVTVEWHQARGADSCPKTLGAAEAGPPVQQGSGTRFDPVVDFVDTFCVWAVARDNQGAKAFAFASAKVENVSPLAVITVVRPAGIPTGGKYRLYSAFQISGVKSSDPDGAGSDLTLTWQLTRPNGQPEAAPSCPAPMTDEICFAAEVAGEYTVALTVRDALGAEGKTSVPLVVDEDRPPCIRDTSPPLVEQLVRRAEDKLRLEVLSVDDDGDPYDPTIPVAPGAMFVWQWRRMGEADFTRSPVTATSKSAVLELAPDMFLIGDVVEVRVQYLDRVRRSFASCNLDAPTCALDTSHPECLQWVTWKVAFKN